MDKYFHVTFEKEIEDIKKLCEIIKRDNWIDSNTIIVNCSPDYSSVTTQILNHKLSYLNKNELFEQIVLEMPYPTMNQIWNRETVEYELFDRYLKSWVNGNVTKELKYLFVDSGTLRGKNFTKVKQVIEAQGDYDYRFATLYLQKDSIFRPDYVVEEFDFEKQGGLLFQWENQDNKNWNY